MKNLKIAAVASILALAVTVLLPQAALAGELGGGTDLPSFSDIENVGGGAGSRDAEPTTGFIPVPNMWTGTLYSVLRSHTRLLIEVLRTFN